MVDGRTDPDQRLTTGLLGVARGGALNLVGSAVNAVAAFVLILVLTRHLGAAGAGSFLIAIAIFQIVARTAELGVSTGLTWWISRAVACGEARSLRRVLPGAVTPVLVLGSILAVAIAVGSQTASGVFDAPGADQGRVSAHLGALAPFVPVAGLYNATINGTRGFSTMMPSVVIDRLAKPVLQPLLIVMVLSFTDRADVLALAWVGPVVLLTLPAMTWFARLLGKVETMSTEMMPVPADHTIDAAGTDESIVSISARFWRYTIHRSAASMFQVMVTWIDTVLVGALLTTTAAGIYTSGNRYLMIGTFLLLSVGRAVQPAISSALANGDRSGANHLFRTTTAWIMLLVVPVYVLVATFANPLLRLLGPEFDAAHLALVILAGATIFTALCGPVDMVLLMTGRSAWSSTNMAIGLAVNIAANVVLIPVLGITGAGIAYAASIVTVNALPLYQVRRHEGLDPFGAASRRAFVIVLMAVPAAIGARLLIGNDLTGLIVASSIAGTSILIGASRSRVVLELDQLPGARRFSAGGRSLALPGRS